MKIAVYVNLLAIACSAAASPFDAPNELNPSFKNAYAEPTNPLTSAALPGSRIVGGAELAPHAAPYQAALIVNGTGLCSGSLITTTRVLTTASCVDGASYVEVRLGAHRFEEEEDTQVRINSTSFIVHGSYNDDGYNGNNIAIIFLPTQVALDDYIQVVALAPADAGTYEGSRGLLSGWGATTVISLSLWAPALRGAYVTVVRDAICRGTYGPAFVGDNKMCTSGTGIENACYGDGGGPLLVNGAVVGLVAFSGFCDQGWPTGYTRISSFRSWIDIYADL